MVGTDSSLEKGFGILEVMNQDQPVRVRDIHERTGYSKPTIVRLLRVMEARGYVTRLERGAGYCLSSRALSLSGGFGSVSRLIEASAAPLDALTARILWPTAMAALERDHMVVRYSTIPNSPLSHKHSTMNHRLSILHRAHGRAYLAFCPDHERAQILSRLDRSGGDFVAPFLALARQRGWAERDEATEPQTNTIAVPVLADDGRVSATIGATFFRGNMTERAKAAIARDLQATAGEIRERLKAIPPARADGRRSAPEP